MPDYDKVLMNQLKKVEIMTSSLNIECFKRHEVFYYFDPNKKNHVVRVDVKFILIAVNSVKIHIICIQNTRSCILSE